jgi:hypothetical protein
VFKLLDHLDVARFEIFTEDRVASIFRVEVQQDPHPPEKLVTNYQITRRNNPENHELYIYMLSFQPKF